MIISKHDLLSIKDFSKLTGIKQSTLRYYDDLGLFTPAVRAENGYRYYLPQQIITINSIHMLHELDMPIRLITDIQNHRTPELMFDVLSEKEDEMSAELLRLQRDFNVVQTLRRMIQMGLAVDETVIETRYFEEMPIVIGPVNDFKSSDVFYAAFLEFCASAKQYRIDLRLPVGGLFKDFDSFCEKPSEPTNWFSVDVNGLDKRRGGKYVSAFVRGYYGETGDLVDRLQKYIRDNNITTVGPVYNVFLHDELSVNDPDHYLMHCTVEAV